MKKEEIIYHLKKILKNKQEVLFKKQNYSFEQYSDEELRSYLIEQNEIKISRLITETNALTEAIYLLTYGEPED